MKRLLLLITLFLVTSNSFAKSYPKITLPDFSEIVKDLLPAVVNISTSQEVSTKVTSDLEDVLKTIPNNSIFSDLRKLLESQKLPKKQLLSAGSGFIISEDGYVITNYHVIDGATEIMIIMHDSTKIKAKIIGIDKRTDIALLKINPKKKLKYVKFGDSDKAKIGEWIIAIGNPFTLGGTVTAGIISARGRDIGSGQITDFIQTDAAINKGNSGGPLFNLQGEVIGIATAIFSPSGGNIGIGFATPSKIAKNVIKQLKNNGKITRGFLGVSIQDVTKEIANSIGVKKREGAFVISVFPDSPAKKAGIIPTDIIIKYNGKKIKSMRQLPVFVSDTKIGSKVKIIVIRKGKKKKIWVKIGKLKDNIEDNKKTLKDYTKSYILGIGLSNITKKIRTDFDIASHNGIVITDIKKDSKAIKENLLRGDIILSANQIDVNSISKFKKIIDKSNKQKRDGILLFIKRDKNSFVVILPK